VATGKTAPPPLLHYFGAMGDPNGARSRAGVELLWLLRHNPTRPQKNQGNRICYTQPGGRSPSRCVNFWKRLSIVFMPWAESHSAIAEARRAATHAKQVEALRRWNPADLPQWLDQDFYRTEILPRLSAFTAKAIRLAMDVSHPYATLIKRGERMPRPRHWLALSDLTGCTH